MNVDSLPPRPLTTDEADRLVRQTDQRFIPDTFIEVPSGTSNGYVAAIYHREDGELLLGLCPEEVKWKIVGKQPPTATLTETYERLDEWAEENYGEWMEGRL